jgi:hypothetical protein
VLNLPLFVTVIGGIFTYILIMIQLDFSKYNVVQPTAAGGIFTYILIMIQLNFSKYNVVHPTAAADIE